MAGRPVAASRGRSVRAAATICSGESRAQAGERQACECEGSRLREFESHRYRGASDAMISSRSATYILRIR